MADMTGHPRIQIRVTVQPGKPALRELLIDQQKVFEFRNRAEMVEFGMQMISTFRYD